MKAQQTFLLQDFLLLALAELLSALYGQRELAGMEWGIQTREAMPGTL